jgi:hypothetical protein
MDATPPAAGSTSRPSPSTGIPLALRRLAIGLAGLAVAVLAGAACALSFDDLRVLAIAGQAEPGLAYLYPAGFDALLVVALISVPLLRGARLLVRLQAGLVLLLLLAAAATAGVATASGVAFDVRRAAIVVALVPWVMLVVALWLLLVLVKHAQARRADLDGVSDAGEIVPFDGEDRDNSDGDRPQSLTPLATSPSSGDTPIASARPSGDIPIASARPSGDILVASARPDTAHARETASQSGTTDPPDASYRSSSADGPAVPTDPYPVLKEAAAPIRHAPSPALAPEATKAPETASATEPPTRTETTSEPLAASEPLATPTPGHQTDSATETGTAPQPVADPPSATGSEPQLATESPATTGSAPPPRTEQAPPERKQRQRPIRWGDLVRPYAGDVLVHPRPKKTPPGATPPAESSSEHSATPTTAGHSATSAEPAAALTSTSAEPATESTATPSEPTAELGATPAAPAAEVIMEDIADDEMWNDEDTVSVVDLTATEFAASLESAGHAEPSDMERRQRSNAEPAQPSSAADADPVQPLNAAGSESPEPAEVSDAEPSELIEPAAASLGEREAVPLVAASDEASAELSRRYGEAAEEIAERFARPRHDESEVDTRPLRQLRDEPDPAHASEAADPEEQPTSRREPQNKESEDSSVPLAPPSGRMRSTPRPPS